MRAVVEGVLEPVLFNPEAWSTYIVSEETVRGGAIEKLGFFGRPAAPVKPASPAAPLRHRMGRRSVQGS